MPCARSESWWVGGENDQVGLAGERGLRMKGQERVQHRERALVDAKARASRTDGVNDISHLCTTFSGGRDDCYGLRCHMGERQRSAPEGRRWDVWFHGFASSGQRKSARRNGEKIAARVLTVIRGSVILCVAKQLEKGFRNSVSGAFFFCRVAPC